MPVFTYESLRDIDREIKAEEYMTKEQYWQSMFRYKKTLSPPKYRIDKILMHKDQWDDLVDILKGFK